MCFFEVRRKVLNLAFDRQRASVQVDQGFQITQMLLEIQARCPSKQANKYAPPNAREAIAECDQAIRYSGQMVPAILFLLTILFPIIPLSIFTIAGVALIGGGAFWKWTVILRAGVFEFPSSRDAATRLRPLCRPCPARRMAALA